MIEKSKSYCHHLLDFFLLQVIGEVDISRAVGRTAFVTLLLMGVLRRLLGLQRPPIGNSQNASVREAMIDEEESIPEHLEPVAGPSITPPWKLAKHGRKTNASNPQPIVEPLTTPPRKLAKRSQKTNASDPQPAAEPSTSLHWIQPKQG